MMCLVCNLVFYTAEEILYHLQVHPVPKEVRTTPQPPIYPTPSPILTGPSAPTTVPPVDKSARILTNGAPVSDDEDHRALDPVTGQQRAYVVLSPEERAKGFVRPVRRTYTHVGREQAFENPDHPSGETKRWTQRVGGCGHDTTMSIDIAETYARCPTFYSGTFCIECRVHLPLDEFVWKGTTEQVGS